MPQGDEQPPSVPDPEQVEARMSSLTPAEQHALVEAVEQGLVAPDREQAAIAVALANVERREALRDLFVWQLTPVVAVTVVFAVIVRPGVGFYVVFAMVVGLLAGLVWWPGTWRPIRKAEAANREFVETGQRPEGHDRKLADSYHNWLGAVALSGLGLGIAGVLFPLLRELPAWIGPVVWIAATVLVKRALDSLVPNIMEAARRRRLPDDHDADHP